MTPCASHPLRRALRASARPLHRLLWACTPAALLALAISGCSGDSTPPPNGPDAGTGVTCNPTGVSKGPWALAVDRTSAVIRWEACRAGAPPEVAITPEMGGAEVTVASTESSFEVTTTYVAPLNPDAPDDEAGTYFMHEAKATGLGPSSCYRYHLSADAERKGRFCTARMPGDPVRFMAIGDTNPALAQTGVKLLPQVLPSNPDFIVHGGDIQYYDSGLETWAYWFPQMQPMLSQGAFFPAIGNHESEKSEEYSAYTVRFFGNAGFDGGHEHYRFESGGVWFFSLNSEEPLETGSDQATWLVQQLADAAARPGFRFSVVYIHKPLVTCGDTGDSSTTRMQLTPFLEQNHVALVIQAHMHGYERFELGPITYLTSGGGGGAIGNVDENITRPECPMRLASGPYKHAVILDVAAGELQGTAIDDQGTVRDTFTKIVP
jgi:acid phosphatase type 7